MVKRVSDEIGESYKEWTPERPIIIHAPTGAGKTYFVLNILLPYIHHMGKKMVYLCNRSALQQQVENKLKNDPALSPYKDTITTCSYQRFATFRVPGETPPDNLSNAERKQWEENVRLMRADYYILDEAHYFLADSGFNLRISDCLSRLKLLKTRKKDSIWIYMTATLPYLLLYLKPPNIKVPYLENPVYQSEGNFRAKTGYGYEETYYFSSVKTLLEYREQLDILCWQYSGRKGQAQFNGFNHGTIANYNPSLRKYFSDKYSQYEYKFTEAIKTFDYYYIAPDFSQINPIYFSDNDELLTTIKNTPPDEKWLIFVESENDGKTLKEALVSAGYKDTVFITSKTKTANLELAERKTLEQIVKYECFSQKVVLATKVLDNGINLCDKSLKHIVVQSIEQTEFLQMLGRKRFIDSSDNVNLYIKNLPEGTLRKEFQRRIQNVMLFWHQLYAIKARKRILPSFRFSIDGFLSRYTEGGHYIPQYRPFIIPDDVEYSRIGNAAIKDDPGILIDLYVPPRYTQDKLIYDYYKMLAMFETAQDEREERMCYEQFQDETEYQEFNSALQQSQYIWLREQLSWIGFNVGNPFNQNDNTLYPANGAHWINIQNGLFPAAKKELLDFLHSHSGILTEDQEKELKQLYRKFISLDFPPRKNTKLKGSIKKIQELFDLWNFPYKIESKKMTYNRKQRQWWILEHK